MNKRTYFIKSSHPSTGEPQLNPVKVGYNSLNNIETTLILDANILIAMERVVKKGNKWPLLKEHGLHNLVKLLKRCPPQSVCISPGISLEEMPPAIAEVSRVYYEEFCSIYLPGFIDIPNCVYQSYSGKDRDYGFQDLAKEARAILALPFVSLLLLIIIDLKNISPVNKFIEYLDSLESTLDILSAKEIEIAKYCFAVPAENSKSLINIRRTLRKNFLKTEKEKLSKNFEEVMKVAFNGACDLHLINSANVIDQNGIDGVKQDCWIATQDKKLVEFSKIFNYINIDGEAGKFAASSIFEEHTQDEYWIEVNERHRSLLKERREYHYNRDIDINHLLEISNETIEGIKSLI